LEEEELAVGNAGRFESVITGWLFLELVLSESEDSTRRRRGRDVVVDEATMGEKEPGAREPVGRLDMVVRVFVL